MGNSTTIEAGGTPPGIGNAEIGSICEHNQKSPATLAGESSSASADASARFHSQGLLETSNPMSDWFKFYDTDLDETRLKYAINKLPEVVSVLVGILTECCRLKSDTIRWGDNAIELFGFSQRLNVTLPKVNEAVNVLCEIGYISRKPNALKVLNWNDRQSEYCQKKKRKCVRTHSGQAPDSVGLEREDKIDKIRKDLSPLAITICSWFKRRETTPWSTRELKALREAEACLCSAEDISLLEAYYKSDCPYKRRDVLTLLNNWNGEIDRARDWKKNPKNYASHNSNPKEVDRNAGTANAGKASNYANVGLKSPLGL